MTNSMGIDAVRIANAWVHPLPVAKLNAVLQQSVESGATRIIAHHNLHSLYLQHSDPSMQSFYRQAECTQIDGMGIVLLANLLGVRIPREARVTYVDWVPWIMRMAAEHSWRIFYLGSKEGVAELAANRLRSEYPGLQIQTRHGYFAAQRTCQENRDVLGAIKDFQPHVLLVGMGMPRQEHWVLENLSDLSGMTILTVGAAFDYYAGVIPTPPRWSGRVGLEWLFRLAAEPQRLWRRYLVEPWFLLAILAGSLRHSRNSS